MKKHHVPSVSRRRMLGAVVTGTAGSALAACGTGTSLGTAAAALSPGRTVYDLKIDFGAIGDGVADDYSALAMAAASMSDSENVTLYIPEGTYFLGRTNSDGSPRSNIVWSNIIGLCIVGEDAPELVVDGAYTRTSNTDATPVPLDLVLCKNAVIRGLTMDGGVRGTTASAGLAEGTSYGIRTSRCESYVIEDVDVHHFATDGILLGTGGPLETAPDGSLLFFADRDALLRRVRSTNHGRSSLTVNQVVGLVAVGCTFDDARRDIGAYPGHGPGAGVNVEPGRAGVVTFDGTTQILDENTTNIAFQGCQMAGSLGAQVAASGDARVGSVLIDQCVVSADSDSATWAIAALASDVTIRASQIVGSVYGNLGPYQAELLTVESCTITTYYRGIAVSASSTSPSIKLRVLDTTIRFEADVAGPLVQLRTVDDGVLIGCEFTYAAATYTRTDGRWHIPFVLDGVSTLANNIWTSEVDPMVGELSLGAEYRPGTAFVRENLVGFIPRADVPNPTGTMVWTGGAC